VDEGVSVGLVGDSAAVEFVDEFDIEEVECGFDNTARTRTDPHEHQRAVEVHGGVNTGVIADASLFDVDEGVGEGCGVGEFHIRTKGRSLQSPIWLFCLSKRRFVRLG
jgi:hypothetical protein